MIDGASNFQLRARLLKVNYPKMTGIRGVEHTVSVISMMCLKYPLLIKRFLPIRWYKIFLVMVYLTSLINYLNQNIKIFTIIFLLFSGNDTRMAGYFMVIHKDLRMQKNIECTILSAEFNIIPTNEEFTKAVRYIHDNNLW